MKWKPIEGAVFGYPGAKFMREDDRYVLTMRLVDRLYPGADEQRPGWTVHDRRGVSVCEIAHTDAQSLFIQANDQIRVYEQGRGRDV